MHIAQFLFLFLLFLLSSCASLSNQTIDCEIQASHWINPDDDRHPLAVMVKLYQLIDDDRFLSASFTDLWKRDRAFIGREILSKYEWVLVPGQRKIIHLRLNPETRFIAAFAIFRRHGGEKWRAIAPIGPGGLFSSSRIKLAISGRQLEFQR